MLRMPKNLAMFKFAFFDLEGYPRNNAATRRMEFNPNVDNMDYSNLLAINHSKYWRNIIKLINHTDGFII